MLNYFQLLYDYFSLFNLFHLRLFSTIVNFFDYYMFFFYCKLFQFKLLAAIISYLWLLKLISPYVIIGNSRLL